MPKILKTFKDIADSFDGFIFDIWGVIHNGHVPFPGTLDCLKLLRQKGKKIFLLSNAPRLPEIAVQRLDSIGLTASLYDGIYTSGLECHERLVKRDLPFYQNLGNKIYHIGEARDRSIFNQLKNYYTTSKISEADFILVTGTFGANDDINFYKNLLKNVNIPMVCANADLEVVYGNQLILCAGAIARLYQAQGGKVFSHGKPSVNMYQTTFNSLQSLNTNLSKDKVLMIGDSLYTDIKGANDFGISSLLVGTGVLHRNLAPRTLLTSNESITSSLSMLCERYQAKPEFFMDYLHI